MCIPVTRTDRKCTPVQGTAGKDEEPLLLTTISEERIAPFTSERRRRQAIAV